MLQIDYWNNYYGPIFEGFAQNDLYHEDLQSAEYPKYTKGLNLALHNYLNGTGFTEEIQHWFVFPVPATSQPEGLIDGFLGVGFRV